MRKYVATESATGPLPVFTRRADVERRVGDVPFEDLDRHITRAELERLSDEYKRVTGFARDDIA